jgi:hypothetical protein
LQKFPARRFAMKRKSIALAFGAAFFLTSSAAFAHTDVYYFEDDECGGTISCSSEFVGDVIALPFRVVANVIDFVF